MKCLRRIGEFFLAIAVFAFLLMILKEWQEEEDNSGVPEGGESDGGRGCKSRPAPLAAQALPTISRGQNSLYRR